MASLVSRPPPAATDAYRNRVKNLTSYLRRPYLPTNDHCALRLDCAAACSRIGTVHEDVTTEVIGKIGTWQWLVTIVCTVLMMPVLFNQYADIFMLSPAGVTCIPSQGLVVLNSSLCSVTVRANDTVTDMKCTKWHVKLLGLIWLKKSWLLFCEEHSMWHSTAIICRFGLVFGFVIFGSVADSFGRKPALFMGIISTLSTELVLTFCDSQAWYRLFVFLKSVCASAGMYMGLLIICEIASNRWRSALGSIVMIPRLLATVCTMPLAYSSPNTETYAFTSCLFSCVCVIILRWCPESPQWLLYNRKIALAERTLQRAAKMNGIQLCREFKIRPVNNRAYHSLDEPTTCVGLLTIPNPRFVFLMTSMFWAVYYFLWSSLYLISYDAQKSGSILLKVFCIAGGLSCLTFLGSKRIKFRYLLVILTILTGASTISIMCVQNETILVLVSSTALSCGILVFALILNITPRLFATNIRGIVFGYCHATGQLGSTVSYIIFLFYPTNEITFLVTVSVATIILVGLCLVLPDVDGRELPDVLEDMDYYSELSKPLRWATQKTNSPSNEEIEMRVYSFGSTQAAPDASDTRTPARRIGFVKIRGRMAQYLRNNAFVRRHTNEET